MLRLNLSNYFILIISFLTAISYGQAKHGFQWVIGYDTTQSKLDGNGILMNFNIIPVEVSVLRTINAFSMESSNTSMCDQDGNLLFHSNGCFIVNAVGKIMENGNSINPGIVERDYCPDGNPATQGVIALPAPGNKDLYYVFNLDLDLPYFMLPQFVGIAPERIYYHTIDMTLNSGLGKVILKNQIALKDTLGRSNLLATRHANGIDWWIIAPKSHTNCYFLILLNSNGVQPSELKCTGENFNDVDLQGQAVFSPDGKKFVRFLPKNGLNIYDFNNKTGELSNPIRIKFTEDTTFSSAGVAISPNSRFLYATTQKKLYQFDLLNPDIVSSKILIDVWDGISNPFKTIFDLAALAPDGKIYIAGFGTHTNLHIIHRPNCQGLACQFEQRGLNLTGYNYASIPNLPHYNANISNYTCDSIIINTKEDLKFKNLFEIYPTITSDKLHFKYNGHQFMESIILKLINLAGIEYNFTVSSQAFNELDISSISS